MDAAVGHHGGNNARRINAAAVNTTVKLKISEKGALSVYGLQRFPITLYREQWERLLAEKEAILAFIEANKGQLSSK